jgi:hypothetical protein
MATSRNPSALFYSIGVRVFSIDEAKPMIGGATCQVWG